MGGIPLPSRGIVGKSGGRRAEGGGRRAEGGHWADDEGLWQTADGEKFLLRFSTAAQMSNCRSEASHNKGSIPK